jgi:hypothetical protein
MERETGLESVYCSHGSSLLATNCFFSKRHGGANHFSSCLFLQNLGKSRKVCDPVGVSLMAGRGSTLTPLHEAIRNTSSSIYNDRDRNHNKYR